MYPCFRTQYSKSLWDMLSFDVITEHLDLLVWLSFCGVFCGFFHNYGEFVCRWLSYASLIGLTLAGLKAYERG